LLRGARPARYPGIVAGERRRPAASRSTIKPSAITTLLKQAPRPIQDAVETILPPDGEDPEVLERAQVRK
jgi:hypothetical protein